MKTFVSICIALFLLTNSYSQQLESVGAGIIDFLLTNPKTANKTNPSEAAALSVIGNLLNQSSQRKHEINVAQAGRDEIIINSNNGNQATLYSDDKGNVYLLSNGKIYPISTNLVNQAKTESVKPTMVLNKPMNDNYSLSEYDLDDLRAEYNFEKESSTETKSEIYRYYMNNETEFINEIAFRLRINPKDIYFQPYIFVDKKGRPATEKKGSILYSEYKFNKDRLIANHEDKYLKGVNNVYSMGVPIVRTPYGCKEFTYASSLSSGLNFKFPGFEKFQIAQGFAIYVNSAKSITVPMPYKLAIKTIFTCNWAKDFDGSGWDFEDFQGIKRSFTTQENILFVLGYTSEKEGKYSFEIFDAVTGKTINSSNGIAESGGKILTYQVEGGELPVGVYIFNYTIKVNDEDTVSKTEKFEIVKKPL